MVHFRLGYDFVSSFLLSSVSTSTGGPLLLGYDVCVFFLVSSASTRHFIRYDFCVSFWFRPLLPGGPLRLGYDFCVFFFCFVRFARWSMFRV